MFLPAGFAVRFYHIPGGDLRDGPEQAQSRDLSELQQQAEERVFGQGIEWQELPPEQIADRLHALRVRQSELEMQNAALQRVQQELEDIRDRYSRLYDMATVGYCTIDDRTRILQINLTAVRMLGREKSRLLEQPLTRFILREDQDIFSSYRKQLDTSRETNMCELRLIKADGTLFHARLEATAVTGDAIDAPVYQMTISDITEWIQSESARCISEAYWYSLVNNAPNFITIVDRDGIVEFINHTVPGITVQDVIGQSVVDFVLPEYRELAESSIKAVFENGEANYYVSAALGPDGAVAWYENHLGPIKQDDQVVAVTLIATDISERKEVDETIQSLAQFPSENRSPVMRVSQNGKILYANDASAPLLASWACQVCDQLPESWSQTIADAIHSGEDRIREVVCEERIFSVHVSPVANAGYANLYGRDITEQKQAMEMLKEQHQFINTVFQSLTHPFYVLDANDYTIKMANTAAKAGTFPERITCYALTHFRDTPCDGVEHLCPLHEVKRTGKPTITEHIHMDRQGNSRTYEVHGHPIFDNEGNVSQIIEYTLDITERVRAEEALRKARDELELRVKERTAQLAMSNEELQAAVSQNTNLYKAEQQARHIAETLASASLALTQTLDRDVVMETMLEYLHQLVSYDSAYFILPLDETHLVVRASRYREDQTHPQDVLGLTIETQAYPYIARLLTTRKSVLIQDTREFLAWKHFAGLQQIHSWLGVPLVADGKVIGLCTLDKIEPGFFTQQHIHSAEALVSQATVTMQNAWLFEQVRAGREQQRSLSHRLVEIQETERRYIARELHDEAGQALTSLMVGLRLLEREAENPEGILTGTTELKRMVDGVLENLHRLASDLRPTILDHLGLVAALRQYVEAISDRHSLVIQFEAIGFDDHLPSDVEISLYRIVQEALTNIVRHAQASRVDVLLEQRSDKLIVLVEDNGIGFDFEAAVQSGRLGLFGIRERTEMLGGTLMIESTAGSGTTLRVEVPYDNPDTHRR